MKRTLNRSLAIVGIAFGLVVGACGGDDGERLAGGAGKTITVEAVDFGFKGLPARVAAGTRLNFLNTSRTEAHEFAAVRLPDGETRPVADLVKLPMEELMGLVGGPPAVVLLAPPGGGEQIVAEGDGTLTEPGRYLVICTVPTGADPDAFLHQTEPGPIAGGAPHFHHGMYGELVVA